jgi:hypothetical protein
MLTARAGVVLVMTLALAGAAPAGLAQAATGSLVGHVLMCRVGSQTPATDILVRVRDTNINTRTDASGAFTLTDVPAPAIVTIDAGDDGSGAPLAARFGVPTAPGELVDMGDVLIGGSPLAGCDDQDDAGG